MRFKLDENIGSRGLQFLKAAGHDVITAREQDLQGATDERLFEVCAGEGRALITLDHDFGQVLGVPPESSAGVVILEVGPRATAQAVLDRLREFLAVLETQSVAPALWIVEPGRVRIHPRDREE